MEAMYDDEYDDTYDGLPAVSAGQRVDISASDSEGDDRWAHHTNRGKGGKAKGKGGGKGKGDVKGQTRQASHKEQNKARYGNHNRRAAHQKKMGKGMS